MKKDNKRLYQSKEQTNKYERANAKRMIKESMKEEDSREKEREYYDYQCRLGCDLSQGDDFYAFTSIQRTSRKNFQSRNEKL